MWERLAHPRDTLAQIYDITYYDEQGAEMKKDGQYHALSSDIEREMQFRELAECMGASTYHIHLMTHKEIWTRIKKEEGSLLDQYLGFVARTIGLDRALETLPLVLHHQETISLGLDKE